MRTTDPIASTSRPLLPNLSRRCTDERGDGLAPVVWYDVLHVAEVLTRFPWFRQDARLLEIVSAVAAKADGQGRFAPESVWMAWKGWEFGQKRNPSRWVTFLALRVLRRIG